MKKQSIWLEEKNDISFPTLSSNIETEVLIVGGGIVGVLCAYELKQRNINYVLVEKDKIGLATSKDTTAFITVHHENLYQNLIKQHGLKKAKAYLDLNVEALHKYQKLSKKYDFDYEEASSTFYSTSSPDVILEEKKALEKLNYESLIIDNIPLDVEIKAAITVPHQAIINPYKLITALSKELNIYENTFVNKICKNVAYTTSNNTIKFKYVIIATHYPFKNILGLYIFKLFQRRSYVCSIKTDRKISGSYCSIDEDGLYFRQYKNSIIIGGNDRDTKEIPKDDFIRKIESLQLGNIDNIWSGQDCITLDTIPYIGRLHMFKKNYLVATGFNLWGFTWAMASASILADIVQGKEEVSLVSPNRNCFNKQLLLNIGNACKNLLNLKTPRCKHFGCSLKYNEIDKTWECPCHGSRYDEKGNVLDGPTIKPLKK